MDPTPMIASLVLTLSPAFDATKAIQSEVDRHWAKLQDVTLTDSPYRDKQRFCSDLDELLEKQRVRDRQRAKIAGRLVKNLEEDAPPGLAWRVHELCARILEPADAEGRRDALDAALEAYPNEPYAQPSKHSYFHHLVSHRFDAAWDAAGREDAEKDLLERVAKDARFQAVYVSDFVDVYLERGASAFAEPFFEAVAEAAEPRAPELAKMFRDVDIPDLRMVEGDPMKRYLVLGGEAGDGPRDLVVILPGGNGQALDFRPWLTTLTEDLHDTHRFVVLSAPVWQEGQGEQVVWVTERWKRDFRAKFGVESFAREVAAEMRESEPSIRNAYMFAWSSGGPAAYATVLDKDDTFGGAYVLASVFKPNQLDLKYAKGRRFWLQQGESDRVTAMRFAVDADQKLSKAGAETHLERFEGGHGFSMPEPKESLAQALRWLAQ